MTGYVTCPKMKTLRFFATNLFPHFEHNTKGFIPFHLDIPLNL